jgi:hypothetical protein
MTTPKEQFAAMVGHVTAMRDAASEDFNLHAATCGICRSVEGQESFELEDLCDAGAKLWAKVCELAAL